VAWRLSSAPAPALGNNAGVSDAIEFDPDLYRETAGHYDRFGVLYPQPMIDDLVARVEPSGRGRMLDLACGEGQIMFAVSGPFAEVCAADQEPDMIDAVREGRSGRSRPRARGRIGGREPCRAGAGV
jgi:SAM-dependent methyltransferase